MWPETEELLYATMQDVAGRAALYGRTVDFGLRIHVIVRETEAEASAWSHHIMSRSDSVRGQALKAASRSSWSLGVQRQNALREGADAGGYAEPLLWTGINKDQSGAGAALVGSADQLIEKINRYMDMGIRSFIFSGYSLLEEADYVGRLLLPRLPNTVLNTFNQRPAIARVGT